MNSWNARVVSINRYWCCDIKGAPSGKLEGKTVAIKDNTCVAGVPMMNGSRILEGFVPDIDATVVSRILDAGGRILGKAVCENLCCSGASFTAATGPVVNPHDKTRMAGGSSSGCAALVRRYRNHFNYNPRDPFFPAILKGDLKKRGGLTKEITVYKKAEWIFSKIWVVQQVGSVCRYRHHKWNKGTKP